MASPEFQSLPVKPILRVRAALQTSQPGCAGVFFVAFAYHCTFFLPQTIRKRIWAELSAKATIRAMCATYLIAQEMAPDCSEVSRVRQIIFSRYGLDPPEPDGGDLIADVQAIAGLRAVPLQADEACILHGGLKGVTDLHSACRLVILAEAGVPVASSPRLERALDRVISREVRRFRSLVLRSSRVDSSDWC